MKEPLSGPTPCHLTIDYAYTRIYAFHEMTPFATVGVWLALAAADPAPDQDTVKQWSLEEAIAFAQENSPDAKSALERIRVANAGIEAVDATFSPVVDVGASYFGTSNPAQTFAAIVNQSSFEQDIDFNNLDAVDDLNLRATFQVPIWVGGSRFSARKAAQAGRAASEDQAAAIRNALGFMVTQAYFNVSKARGFMRAAQAEVAAFEGSVRVARERFDGGTLLRQTLLDVEVRLARAKESLIRSRNAEALALEALRNVMGLEAGPLQIIEAEADLRPPEGDVGIDARHELSAFAHELEQRQFEVKGARSGYWPRIDAVGSLLFNHGFVNDGNTGSFVAGLVVGWRIWDGFSTRANVRRAEAESAVIQQRYRKLRQDISLEAEQARIRFEDAQERLRVTEREIELAEESAELARARFEEGLALSNELIDAETALTGARVRRAESEANRWIAVAAYRKALGLPMTTAGE